MLRMALSAGALAGLAGTILSISGVPASADGVVFVGERDAAIHGYDPVAYFSEGRPVEGSADFTFDWMDANWRFASAANRDAFAAEPEKYAPQYGGYCAWAVSQGYTARIDPDAWRIVEGKLYLNYSRSVQRRWERDIPGHIAKAESNWPGIRDKLSR